MRPIAPLRVIGMPVSISVVNQKGGVGKTTTAVNLAACLAAAGHSTLLVDADPQGNATSGVGVIPRDLECTIYDALLEQVAPEEAILPTFVAGLSLIPANIDLSGIEIALIEQPDRLQRMKNLLAAISDRFEFILIDSPPSLSLLALNVLAAAERVIVPVQCEYYALEGLTTLLQTFERVRETVNPNLDILGILMTMYDKRTNLAQQVVEEVERVFQQLVFRTVIPRSVKLSEAPSFGKPVIYYDFNSKGSEAYIGLCQEVLERVEETRAGQGAGRPAERPDENAPTERTAPGGVGDGADRLAAGDPAGADPGQP